MVWTIKFEKFAAKQLKKLDKPISKKIIHYLKERVTTDPRSVGSALLGNKAGLWRYRVDNYRIICKIEDKQVIVTVVRIGHRKNVYRK